MCSANHEFTKPEDRGVEILINELVLGHGLPPPPPWRGGQRLFLHFCRVMLLYVVITDLNNTEATLRLLTGSANCGPWEDCRSCFVCAACVRDVSVGSHVLSISRDTKLTPKDRVRILQNLILPVTSAIKISDDNFFFNFLSVFISSLHSYFLRLYVSSFVFSFLSSLLHYFLYLFLPVYLLRRL